VCWNVGISYNVWLRGLCAGMSSTTLRHTGHVATHYITPIRSVFHVTQTDPRSSMMMATGVPRWGVQPPPPPDIPKFWNSRAKFPVPEHIICHNLIRIRVSLNYKLSETPTRGLLPPDPPSLCPLSSSEFVEPHPKKNPGYATGCKWASSLVINHSFHKRGSSVKVR
jgi:hypothetical protein